MSDGNVPRESNTSIVRSVQDMRELDKEARRRRDELAEQLRKSTEEKARRQREETAKLEKKP